MVLPEQMRVERYKGTEEFTVRFADLKCSYLSSSLVTALQISRWEKGFELARWYE